MLAALRADSADDPGFEARFAQWWAVESGRRLAWIASVDDTPVGMVNLTVFERMPWPGRPPARWGYLGNAFVVASHRSRGIGTALVAELLAYARSAGLVRVVLSPSERSVPLYRRAGFGPADALLVWTPQ